MKEGGANSRGKEVRKGIVEWKKELGRYRRKELGRFRRKEVSRAEGRKREGRRRERRKEL